MGADGDPPVVADPRRRPHDRAVPGVEAAGQAGTGDHVEDGQVGRGEGLALGQIGIEVDRSHRSQY